MTSGEIIVSPCDPVAMRRLVDGTRDLRVMTVAICLDDEATEERRRAVIAEYVEWQLRLDDQLRSELEQWTPIGWRQ